MKDSKTLKDSLVVFEPSDWVLEKYGYKAHRVFRAMLELKDLVDFTRSETAETVLSLINNEIDKSNEDGPEIVVKFNELHNKTVVFQPEPYWRLIEVEIEMSKINCDKHLWDIELGD